MVEINATKDRTAADFLRDVPLLKAHHTPVAGVLVRRLDVRYTLCRWYVSTSTQVTSLTRVGYWNVSHFGVKSLPSARDRVWTIYAILR